MTNIIVNWHAVGDAFIWALIGFSLGMVFVHVGDEISRRRRYVKELEARVRERA